MNDNLIERMARAIREGRQCGTTDEPLKVPCSFCYWGPDENTAAHDETGCIWLARAALAAVREPTEGMVRAGFDQTCGDINTFDDISASWSAMIDTALETER